MVIWRGRHRAHQPRLRFVSFAGTLLHFRPDLAAERLLQSFGSPGLSRSTPPGSTAASAAPFSGVFGFMIQLGQVAINNLAPLILAALPSAPGRSAQSMALGLPHPADVHGLDGVLVA